MSYLHRIPIRYGEVDQQGVVFNAHYLAYCDDAFETWLRKVELNVAEVGWDMMLKKAVIEWSGPAHTGEVLDVATSVSRWGNTSFDLLYEGSVGERPVFTATITYVGVRFGTTEPIPPPPEVRTALA